MKSAFVLYSIVFLIIAAAFPLQRNPPRPGENGLGGRPGTRFLNCQKTQDQSGVICDAKNNQSDIRFDFETFGFPSFRAFFFNKTSGIAAQARVADSMASFRIGFYSVFEFADVYPSGYQNETKVNQYRFFGDGLSWSRINLTGPLTDGSGVNSYTFSTTYSFIPKPFWWLHSTPASSNFSFTLIGHISDQFLQTQNFTLAPNSFKFDIYLDHLAYQYSNTTYALVALVEGTSPADQGTNASSRWVSISDFGSFSWLETVSTSDSSSVPVVPTTLEPFDPASEYGYPPVMTRSSPDADHDCDPDAGLSPQRKIVFTVDTLSQPSFIHWDPSLTTADSFTQTSTSTSSPSSATSAVLSFFVIFLLLVLW